MKNIGIYGGTFNPPHLGHENAVLEFLKECPLDKLYVIPSGVPPHKEVENDTPFRHRLKMAKIAFSGLSDQIEISDLEGKRTGKSYTSDTIASLQKEGKLYLLCGTDMFLSLDSWHEPSYIFEHATIVCAKRNDEAIETKANEYRKKYKADIILLKNDVLEISSSQIRNALKQNSNVEKYLKKEVIDYIFANNLYGVNND